MDICTLKPLIMGIAFPQTFVWRNDIFTAQGKYTFFTQKFVVMPHFIASEYFTVSKKRRMYEMLGGNIFFICFLSIDLLGYLKETTLWIKYFFIKQIFHT